ncbi:hypothetical protein [Desulfocurvibacter africanus]|uniref:hypothetical protein n=1 Tax=Desulfocurvibacter africanus TaxID=873 RepID=UPI00034D85C0|nr:hypothetical protein [Desulfocurvibacter africanus]
MYAHEVRADPIQTLSMRYSAKPSGIPLLPKKQKSREWTDASGIRPFGQLVIAFLLA